MSSPSRFGVTNYAAARSIVAGGSVLQNGSGGGAPAVVQDANFPMSNVMQDDQYVLWNTGAAPGTPVQVDITLLAATSLSAASVHALRAAAGASVTSLKVYMQTGAYTPGGTWTLRGTVYSPGRHAGVVFAATSVDSIRYEFACTGQFQTGKFYAGDPFTLGGGTYAGNQGLENSPVRNAVVYSFPSGSIFSFNLGDTGRDVSIEFSELPAADADLLDGLASLVRPFIYVDPRARFYNVLLANKTVPIKMQSPNPLYSASVALTVYP